MENLLTLLFFLFLAVVAMVFLLERFGKPMDEAQQASLSRWILPLVAVLAIASLIRYWMN